MPYRSFRNYLLFGLCASLIVSGIGVLVSLDASLRSVGFFNNPNQLAYFSLLGISSLLVLLRFRIPLKPLVILSLLAGVLGIFAGASLAAMAGLLLVAIGYMMKNISPRRLIATLGWGAIIVVIFAITDLPFVSKVYENVSSRLLVAENKFSGMAAERNYDRILAFPEYTLFGAGEGHLERFYPYSSLEIHSSFGNLLFCYGIIGLGLFLALLYRVLRRAPLSIWLVISGPLLYSLTHMGLRTTMFWILIAVIWSEYRLERKEKSITMENTKRLKQSVIVS